MDTNKFRVKVTKVWHAAHGRGLYAVTMFAVRQPGCTYDSVKECRRDNHAYCTNHWTHASAAKTAGYYGYLLNTDPTFRPTITAKPAPTKRKRNHSWK